MAARRQLTVAWVRSGGVVSRTGACLGADQGTGRPAGISWPAAEGGVLVAGAVPADVSGASFQLVHAAIRRRKPVLIVDLRGLGGLPRALAGICADAGAPLHVFGPDGQGCYEPWRGGEPARQAALVMGMIDWSPLNDHARRACAAYLNDVFAVAAAAPGDPRVPVLDDVAALLVPPALRARVSEVPPYDPRRGALGERVRVSAGLLEADPAAAAFLAGELSGLRACTLGRWLSPGAPGTAQISLPAMVRERAVVLFPLDRPRYGRAAQLIANLVAVNLTAVFAESQRLGAAGDGLAWLGDGDAFAAPALARLISTGAQAGLATVVSASCGPASAPAVQQIAALANVLVIRGPGDPGLAGFPLGAALAGDEFALMVRAPQQQVVPRARFVPGAMP